MTDSQHPLYQKGFRAGRQKTEAEIERAYSNKTRSEQWNEIYIAMLPVAMESNGWKIGDEPVSTTTQRIELAKRWTDAAMKNLR